MKELVYMPSGYYHVFINGVKVGRVKHYTDSTPSRWVAEKFKAPRSFKHVVATALRRDALRALES